MAVLFCLVCVIFLSQEIKSNKEREVFDSFVAEGLLVGTTPGVFHWAARYGSAFSLNYLFRHGMNLEDKDEVMRHTQSSFCFC